MICQKDLSELIKTEKNNYDNILTAIDNVPPCFRETRQNIKEKVDQYIKDTADVDFYFYEKFYTCGFIDGYNFALKTFCSGRNDHTNE